MSTINIGVVGTGKMGSYHCDKLRYMKNVNFIGVYDKEIEKANEICKRLNVESFESYSDLLNSVEAVIIAAPTKFHFSLVVEAINNNKHVLVEKPITISLKEAYKIETLLNDRNLIFQVGHIERFNPVIQQIYKHIDREKMIYLEAKRLGLSNRVKDADVVMDVMIHDIDIILDLVNSPVTRISAEGSCTSSKDKYDSVTALLLFENGVVATLFASNISHEKVRTLTVYEREKVIKTDYLTRQQQIVTDGTVNPDLKHPVGTESVIAKLTTPPVDPLMEELIHFTDCIYSNHQPIVGVNEGVRAVEVALKIKKILKGL